MFYLFLSFSLSIILLSVKYFWLMSCKEYAHVHELILLCSWGRYVVDAADRDSIPISRTELHDLVNKPTLTGIALLVLGNKIDKSEALSKEALVDQL